MNAGVQKFLLPIALAAVLFGASGCKKKKPAVPPPQAEAPTLEAPKPAPPPAETTTAPASPADAATPTTTTQAPPPKPKKPRTRIAKKPSAGVPASTANNGSTPPATVANNTSTPPPPAVITTPSGKVIVPEGSTPEPTGQISTTMPTSKENETKLNTERSLQTTEKDLKAVTWTPSIDQKNMMEQIKTYITQSRSANNEGDVLRASNLAQKARLLCDELLKK